MGRLLLARSARRTVVRVALVAGGTARGDAEFGQRVGGLGLAAIAGARHGICIAGLVLGMETNDRSREQDDQKHDRKAGYADPYALHQAVIPMDDNFRQPRAEVNRNIFAMRDDGCGAPAKSGATGMSASQQRRNG